MLLLLLLLLLLLQEVLLKESLVLHLWGFLVATLNVTCGARAFRSHCAQTLSLLVPKDRSDNEIARQYPKSTTEAGKCTR